MELELEEPWGQLVSIEGGEEERIPILGSRLTIGRGKDVDIVLPNNKFVSTLHCSLGRGEDGEIWIRDTSTNGTLLNGTKLAKNEEVKLSNGDVIRVVYRKDRPDCNVAYCFHDLRPLSDEDATLPLETEDTTLEMTPEYQEGDLQEANEETAAAESRKRPLEEGAEVPDAKKVVASDDFEHKNLEPRLDLKTKSEEKREKEREEEKEGGEKEPEDEEKGGQKSASAAAPNPGVPALEKKDSIEETLMCQICQEILHDCVSLQPCMHSYCAGCYSDWMGHSNTCPACRNKVERISKNHIVNNLVDAYLRSNPDKKRPEEDLKELDEKNKITKDMLYPKRKRRRYDYDDDDEEEEEEEEESSGSSSPLPPPPHTLFSGLLMGHSPFAPALHAVPAPLFLCRQCPSHVDSVPPSPSHPTPPPFTCSPSTNHVLCLCCLQPMPDRRLEADISIPPQKCDICGQAYCHMYWGCRKAGCRGCLNLFKEMDFDAGVLSSLINNNAYESRVLKDYLESKSLTVKDLLQTCCRQLDGGEYHCTDSRTARMSSTTRTCYKCALKNFKDLAYHYRKVIPNDDLPAEVTRRPNCYWGKNCRTQLNKPPHAEKFNHICDQTRY